MNRWEIQYIEGLIRFKKEKWVREQYVALAPFPWESRSLLSDSWAYIFVLVF